MFSLPSLLQSDRCPDNGGDAAQRGRAPAGRGADPQGEVGNRFGLFPAGPRLGLGLCPCRRI